jgi:hypothetical protein
VSEAARHALVPEFLLRRFADEAGRILVERRDRSRRLVLSPGQAAADSGGYTVGPGAGAPEGLEPLLSRIEAGAPAAIERMVGGPFPPAEAARACLSVFFGLRLLLAPGPRAAAAQAVGVLGEIVGAGVEQLAEAAAEAEESEAPDPPDTPEASEAPDAPPAPETAHVLLHDGEPTPRSLARLPRVARLLAARTWQLLRFPGRVLLTGDAPVVLWSRPGGAKLYQVGLATADEVRVPLDPRHALILARHGPAGEVVRDLGDRHARALNRTVAEAALAWMYYHPESDPMEGVELPTQ